MPIVGQPEVGWLPPRILGKARPPVIPPLLAFELGSLQSPLALRFPWALRFVWALQFVLLPAARFLALAALREVPRQLRELGEQRAVAQARRWRFGPFSGPEAGG